jgi:hypothetical protein
MSLEQLFVLDTNAIVSGDADPLILSTFRDIPI